MARTDDLWTAIRRVLPDAKELAAAVAADLDEPLDDVRPSVLIGSIALSGQLGPEAAAEAAIEAELDRLRPVQRSRTPRRLLAVESLDALLAQTEALDRKGSLDLETIVAVQRASGAIAARTDRPLVVLLLRYAVTRRLIWEHCVAAMRAGRLDSDRKRSVVSNDQRPPATLGTPRRPVCQDHRLPAPGAAPSIPV